MRSLTYQQRDHDVVGVTFKMAATEKIVSILALGQAPEAT